MYKNEMSKFIVLILIFTRIKKVGRDFLFNSYI